MWVCIKVYTSTGNEIIMNDYVTSEYITKNLFMVYIEIKIDKCWINKISQFVSLMRDFSFDG